MSIQERVMYLICWIANIPQSSICPTTNLKEDLNLDSIDLMLLIVKLGIDVITKDGLSYQTRPFHNPKLHMF